MKQRGKYDKGRRRQGDAAEQHFVRGMKNDKKQKLMESERWCDKDQV